MAALTSHEQFSDTTTAKPAQKDKWIENTQAEICQEDTTICIRTHST